MASRSTTLHHARPRHKEDPAYARHVSEYIETKLREGALFGPFDVPPFTPWAQCSPIMTRPKSTPRKQRIIVDLSFPQGASVNTGIPRREYLGIPHSYRVPSVADLGARLVGQGRGAYLWSADV